jgi:heat shock protein HslJ
MNKNASAVAMMLLIFLTASLSIFNGCSSGTKQTTRMKGTTAPSDLYNTKWMIQTLNGTRVITPEGGVEVSLTIASDGSANGSAGCNTFSGKAEVSGSTIKFGPLATTRKMCPEQMDTERDFLAAMGKTVSYGISGNTLSLMDKADNVVATFKGFQAMGTPGK